MSMQSVSALSEEQLRIKAPIQCKNSHTAILSQTIGVYKLKQNGCSLCVWYFSNHFCNQKMFWQIKYQQFPAGFTRSISHTTINTKLHFAPCLWKGLSSKFANIKEILLKMLTLLWLRVAVLINSLSYKFKQLVIQNTYSIQV